MKLISRKAITATIAAAAISTASLTAPAMAQTSETDAPVTPTSTTTPAPAEEGSSSADFGSSDSDLFKDKDGKEMSTAQKIKEIVSILTGIGALFGAIVTINNNIDRILKNFKL
ncbi:hypothetical protein [Corynebacterium sp. H130]|uniref:hypothetical protein n=1 Tax=Corynebacterium sp. H130 TaxID=3133444 RepID=UPI0030AF14C6